MHRIAGLSSKAPLAIVKRGIYKLESTAVVVQAAICEFAVVENVLLDNVGRILEVFIFVDKDRHNFSLSGESASAANYTLQVALYHRKQPTASVLLCAKVHLYPVESCGKHGRSKPI